MQKNVISRLLMENTEQKTMALVENLIWGAESDDPTNKECDRILNNIANRIAMYHEGVSSDG